MSTLWTFDGIENKHDAYICEEKKKKFCESLREHTKKIINFDKKKMIPLTNERQESYEKAKSATVPNKSSKINTIIIIIIIINLVDIESIGILLVNKEVLHIAYVICNIVNLNKFMWFFKMDQAMIIIYDKTARKSLEEDLNV